MEPILIMRAGDLPESELADGAEARRVWAYGGRFQRSPQGWRGRYAPPHARGCRRGRGRNRAKTQKKHVLKARIWMSGASGLPDGSARG
jgi:hypothetical protein